MALAFADKFALSSKENLDQLGNATVQSAEKCLEPTATPFFIPQEMASAG
jgi:hypothetical protein